jgi:hypothetical protein
MYVFLFWLFMTKHVGMYQKLYSMCKHHIILTKSFSISPYSIYLDEAVGYHCIVPIQHTVYLKSIIWQIVQRACQQQSIIVWHSFQQHITGENNQQDNIFVNNILFWHIFKQHIIWLCNQQQNFDCICQQLFGRHSRHWMWLETEILLKEFSDSGKGIPKVD